jgi:hypothetical protein
VSATGVFFNILRAKFNKWDKLPAFARTEPEAAIGEVIRFEIFGNYWIMVHLTSVFADCLAEPGTGQECEGA